MRERETIYEYKDNEDKGLRVDLIWKPNVNVPECDIIRLRFFEKDGDKYVFRDLWLHEEEAIAITAGLSLAAIKVLNHKPLREGVK